MTSSKVAGEQQRRNSEWRQWSRGAGGLGVEGVGSGAKGMRDEEYPGGCEKA